MFEQQYESLLQICVTHASHVAASLPPVEHSACAHVPPLLLPPEHVLSPQIDATSATHVLLHPVVQQ